MGHIIMTSPPIPHQPSQEIPANEAMTATLATKNQLHQPSY